MVDRKRLPHLDNVRGLQDRISVACRVEYLDRADHEEAYLDDVFGHMWRYTPREGAGVYGLTDRFPDSPVDGLGNGKFLRVPFRRIPIVEIHRLDQLYELAGSIWSKDDSIKLMWRGQSKSYSLSRNDLDQSILYGETGIEEPSLYPSAARAGLDFATVFYAWSAMLDVFIDEHVQRQCADHPSSAQMLLGETAQFRAGYLYRLWAFATAQHYGLPSVGLDVTNDLDVALLFALHRFSTDPSTGRTTFERVDNTNSPVLYAMGAFENDLFDDAELAPPWLQTARPKAQSAFFHGTGWGLSPNKAAERILLAFTLKDHEGWSLQKPVESLFPKQNEDSFLRFVLDARARFSDVATSAMLNRIYYV